jgi:hypothetical protein
LEPVVELEEAYSEREDDASHGEQEAIFETETTANEADDADREMQHQHEQAKKRTPRQIKRGKSRRAPSSESETGDEPFDKTIE